MEFWLSLTSFLAFFSDFDSWHWQIKNKKLINKGTGREYSYDPSKKGYDLGNGMIIEERYIEDYQKNEWIFCQEYDETFKIKCKNDGSFLKANYDVDADCTTSGNISLLPKIQNYTHRIHLNKSLLTKD